MRLFSNAVSAIFGRDKFIVTRTKLHDSRRQFLSKDLNWTYDIHNAHFYKSKLEADIALIAWKKKIRTKKVDVSIFDRVNHML